MVRTKFDQATDQELTSQVTCGSSTKGGIKATADKVGLPCGVAPFCMIGGKYQTA
ncbi:hypothetical protein [Streptococcus henryi]|uniref:hypothetical protein n=1 Tax=Streptococcus henryi TaxID=439219 RepID=UPI000368FB64|nr:hypothetical protein [Streptococcus henryi]